MRTPPWERSGLDRLSKSELERLFRDVYVIHTEFYPDQVVDGLRNNIRFAYKRDLLDELGKPARGVQTWRKF